MPLASCTPMASPYNIVGPMEIKASDLSSLCGWFIQQQHLNRYDLHFMILFIEERLCISYYRDSFNFAL